MPSSGSNGVLHSLKVVVALGSLVGCTHIEGRSVSMYNQNHKDALILSVFMVIAVLKVAEIDRIHVSVSTHLRSYTRAWVAGMPMQTRPTQLHTRQAKRSRVQL